MIQFRRKKTKKLDLSGKNLDVFPAKAFEDKRITTLDLSNNHIKEIPANIGVFKELRYLHLENNDITQLHNGILGASSLRCLYLNGNPMKNLPDFIKVKAKFCIFTDSGIHRFYPEVEKDDGKRTLQKELDEEVNSIMKYDTIFQDTSSVPTVMDSDISFRRHGVRFGKSLKTCVLFVDIRDSVRKNKAHRTTALADMYSSFVYGVLRISKEYNGHVRNIIGDRVMVVFDEEDCCDNAVKCAGSIMCFCKTQMSKTLPKDTFRCGIGIHFGKMKVIKVGLEMKSEENYDYKNLVWIGEPANLASRLTDMAGKENFPSVIISKDVYKGLTDDFLVKKFISVDRNKFKDVNFAVMGCNLLTK